MQMILWIILFTYICSREWEWYWFKKEIEIYKESYKKLLDKLSDK